MSMCMLYCGGQYVTVYVILCGQYVTVYVILLTGVIDVSLLIFQIIDEQVLCVHGGLSPEVRTVDQVSISRLLDVK